MFWSKLKKETIYIFLFAGVAVMTVVFAKLLDNYLEKEGLYLIDAPINQFIVGIRTPFLNKLFLLITLSGNWEMLAWSSVLGSLLLIAAKKWRYLWVMLVSNSVGLVFTEGVKNIINRPRPPMANALLPESGHAFPSGHSYFAVVFYGLMTYFWVKHFKSRRAKMMTGVLGLGGILALAVSRVYLGVHWPTDVLAGLSSSGAWLLATIAFLEYRHRLETSWKEYNQARVKDGIVAAGVLWIGALVWFFSISLNMYHL